MSLRKFIKTSGPISCSTDDSISKIARKLSKENVGAIVVTENKKPVGLITDRDIVLRLVSKKLDANDTPAEEIMTTPCHTIHADQGVFDAVRAMQEHGCRRLVIVDDTESILGVISTGDVMELLMNELNMLATIMTPNNQKLIPRKVA